MGKVEQNLEGHKNNGEKRGGQKDFLRLPRVLQFLGCNSFKAGKGEKEVTHFPVGDFHCVFGPQFSLLLQDMWVSLYYIVDNITCISHPNELKEE